ncbi:hypothetical protein EDB84DRAFT_1452713 [Lactarius hengduanensis]|nr:hypothetical protein EDB84DRAFT_1452713 [Lactarius hengduanensis]
MILLRPELGKDVNLSSCRGFLTDWDHSIEWRKVPPTPTMDRSGTLPFMSMRLVQAWSRNQPALHTAVDDLESFLWVLVWSLVHIFKKSATITNKSAVINDLAGAFSSYRHRDVLSKYLTIRNEWPDEVFGGLIREWLMTCDDSRMILTKLERTLSKSINDADSQKRAWGELEKHCGEVYIKFIGAGYRHLKNIRTYRDWKQVVDEGGELLNQ